MRTCEQCGTKVPFGVKRRRVGDKLVCDGCLNDRPGMPRSQVNRMGSMLHTAEFPPKKDDSGGSGAPPKPKGMPGQAPAMPPAPAPMGMPNPMDPMGMGMGQPAQPQQPQFAPDQQSDLVVRVCPFCGSGHLIGSSDGSISCGYCDANFTITVMPSHPFQPLVNPQDGSPFTMPTDPDADPNPQIGTAAPEDTPGEGPADPTAQTPVGQPNIDTSPPPGDPGDDALLRQGDPSSPGALDAAFEQVMSGASALAAPVPEDAAKPGQVPTPIPTAPPQLDGGDAPDEDDEDDDEDAEKKKSPPPWAKRGMYITAAGTALDEDAYVAHLRRTVLARGDLSSRVARLAVESLD